MKRHPNPTPTRKRTARRNRTSQTTLNRRMREIWIDGFGLLPGYPTEKQVLQMREALRVLVADTAYWHDLISLVCLKQDVHELQEKLKA